MGNADLIKECYQFNLMTISYPWMFRNAKLVKPNPKLATRNP